MSSQDTLNSAKSEELAAAELQTEVERERANIQALQREMASHDPAGVTTVQSDIDTKNQIVASMQQKIDMHTQNVQKLQQQASLERQREDQEHEQGRHKEGLLEKGVKEALDSNLFG